MQVPKRRGETNIQDLGDEVNGLVYITKAGLEKMKQELASLQDVRLPRVREEVAHAASFGDFSENAEYQDAKRRMRGMLSREMILLDKLKRVQVIDAQGEVSRVTVGSTVTVLVNGLQKAYQIVGSTETNPKLGRISNSSPLGVALLGRKVDEQVTVQSPNGEVVYRILAIE